MGFQIKYNPDGRFKGIACLAYHRRDFEESYRDNKFIAFRMEIKHEFTPVVKKLIDSVTGVEVTIEEVAENKKVQQYNGDIIRTRNEYLLFTIKEKNTKTFNYWASLSFTYALISLIRLFSRDFLSVQKYDDVCNLIRADKNNDIYLSIVKINRIWMEGSGGNYGAHSFSQCNLLPEDVKKLVKLSNYKKLKKLPQYPNQSEIVTYLRKLDEKSITKLDFIKDFTGG